MYKLLALHTVARGMIQRLLNNRTHYMTVAVARSAGL